MKGFLCITNAKTDEEYRSALKRRNIIYAITAIIGIAAAITSYFVFEKELVEMSDKALGFFCGAGTGITVCSIALIIKNIILIKNDKKIKAARIANSDERTSAIANKAQSAALTVLALAIGGGCLIGGIFYPILIDVFSIAVCIWSLSYLVSYLIYSKKM